MIGRLTGMVESGGDGWMIVDVGGVGYVVHASARTLARLAPGARAAVLVETHVREDQITLYGFQDAAEKQCFRWLTGVQGVGGRVALAILSVLSPDELLLAIAAGDRKALARAEGVGPRLAARIVGELEDRVRRDSLAASSPAPAGAVPAIGADGDAVLRDAVSALVNLGYGRSEAFGAVTRARTDIGSAAPLDVLIRSGLKELAS